MEATQASPTLEGLTLEGLLALCAKKKCSGVEFCKEDERKFFWFEDQTPELATLLAENQGLELWFDGHLSGHLYRSSIYETDNSCGNCDGARCEDEDGNPTCERYFTASLHLRGQ